tara:strand:- start:2043 stop:2222 length:180 start_codon:yes stop_codon:yes gene_type:complete
MKDQETWWECTIKIPTLYARRKARSKEEFIQNLLEEYNESCSHLFDVYESDLSEIKGDE